MSREENLERDSRSNSISNPMISGQSSIVSERVTGDHTTIKRFSSKLSRISSAGGSLLQLLGLSRDLQQTIFSRDKYIIRFSSFLIIFVAYGIIFPPLAIIAWSAISLRLLFEEIVIGRVLFYGQGDALLEESLSRNCEDINHYMRSGVVMYLSRLKIVCCKSLDKPSS